MGLADRRGRKLGGFSGGERQRVGIAQALLNDPEVLILDEPTAGLDPQERIRFRALLTGLSRQRLVLLSTHIVSDVEYAADQVILLKRGEIIGQAAPAALLRELEGRVWETPVTTEEQARLSERCLCSNASPCGWDYTPAAHCGPAPHGEGGSRPAQYGGPVSLAL